MSLGRPIQVVLADDHAMVRESLARVLEDSGLVTVIGQASDGLELLSVVERQRPDCVVLDYSMPRLDAPQAIEQLVVRDRQLKVLVLTVHENVHYAVRALEAGAHGYLIKSAAVDELVAAIRALARGEIYISPKVAQDVWQQLRRPKKQRSGLESLSQREFDVLRILGSGVSMQECARQMDVSTSTVSTYRARVLEKLNLTTTAEMIRFALEHDLQSEP
jgi:DNA-binding NarL/FixJ family response regulator